MTDVFLPYTAFHISSGIRALRSESWKPQHVLGIQGLGTTSATGAKQYWCELETELSNASAEFELLVLAGKDALRIARAIRNIKSYRLVTGNPRRFQSLALAAHARSVLMVDEGSGTTHRGGYFDPATPEASVVKRLLTRMGLLPKYASVYAKVEAHPTIYKTSIFPNPAPIHFAPAIRLQEDAEIPGEIQIFVSSAVPQNRIHCYAKWAKNNFCLTPGMRLAIHPAMSSDQRSTLSNALELQPLDTSGLLLEEYIYGLAESGCTVSVMGQANSSTIILASIKHPLIRVDCRQW